MKLKFIFSMSVLAIVAAFSFNAQAASDTDKGLETKMPNAAMQTDKATPMKMKPHSHVEEKTGVPQKSPEATSDKAKAAKDKSKHLHPRDGK